MNRLARNIVICGAAIIVILICVLYFASRKMLQEIESRINQGMEIARVQVEKAASSQYGIQSFDYTPFKCSGLIDYKCKSDKITLYMDDFTTKHKNVHETIQFYNFTLIGENIKSKNHLSFKVSTDIEYPTMSKINTDFKKDKLATFYKVTLEALLPNNLECEQNYIYKTDEDTPHTVTAKTKCNLISKMFDMQLESSNIFTPSIDRPHIIGILYEIAMAMNGDSDKEKLQAQNIPHELLSLRFNFKTKQSFHDFIDNYNELTDEQKSALKIQFDTNMNLMNIVGPSFISKYLGPSGKDIIDGLNRIASFEAKELDINLDLKNPPNFKPIKMFKNMNIFEWLLYFGNNYTISVISMDNTNK